MTIFGTELPKINASEEQKIRAIELLKCVLLEPQNDYDYPPPPTPMLRKDVQPKVIELQEVSKSPSFVRTPGKPVKFPLLSKNYIINESNMEGDQEGIYDNLKTKPPLEVFQFPEPPKEKPPEHYVVRDSNGLLSEYAQPESYKGPKLPEKSPKSILRVPKTTASEIQGDSYKGPKWDIPDPPDFINGFKSVPKSVPNSVPKNTSAIFPTKKVPIKLSDGNFNPYDQMYSILAPNR